MAKSNTEISVKECFTLMKEKGSCCFSQKTVPSLYISLSFYVNGHCIIPAIALSAKAFF